MNDFKKFFFLIGLLIFPLLTPFFSLYGDTTITGNIIGYVRDSAANLPVGGANIDVMRGNVIIASVLTDENGMYSVSGLSAKPHIIRVSSSGFQASLKLGTPILNQTITIDFALNYPPGKLVGQIVNAMTQVPISHALIEMIEENVVIDSVQTQEDGSYMIAEANPQKYVIRVSAADFQATTQDITLLANQTLTANFSLEPFGGVTGQVLHAFTGQPIVDASVEMWRNDVLFATMRSDVNGCFSLRGLGIFQIVVKVKGFYDLEQTAHILSMQNEVLDFSLVCHEPRPPFSIDIKVIYKRFSHRINRIHNITWAVRPDPSVAFYRIYRGKKRIGKVLATDPFIFNDEWRTKKRTTYHITSVNIFHQEGKPISITMN